ncbi:SCO2521 family protein [Actinoplanes sp. NPDC024001]|uniref:SCO2521 family protein n=1 Tax=Actinoplanes sp. NPDC024001 TaxID=3154598 RepID=UPI003402DF6C
MLAFGEVQTGLLQNSTALSRRATEKLIASAVDERVRTVERPIGRTSSSDQLEGVDCMLPTVSGRQTRGVGTVLARVAIVGGHAVQGSACVQVVPAGNPTRLPWSHYLNQPGQLEAIGKLDLKDVALGVVNGTSTPKSLELGAITTRMVDTVQRAQLIDHAPPLRASRTRLRWTAQLDQALDEPEGTFTLISEELRTIELRMPVTDLRSVEVLCEDLALHDWLLTTVLSVVEAALTHDHSRAERVSRLQPLLEHLLHLWMPAAHVPDQLLPVWAALDQRPGLTRQWQSVVARIRDQITVETLDRLQAVDVRRPSGRIPPPAG